MFKERFIIFEVGGLGGGSTEQAQSNISESISNKEKIERKIGEIILKLRTDGFYSGTVAAKYDPQKFKRKFLKGDLGKEIVEILSSTNANDYTINLIQEKQYFHKSKKGPFIINKIIKFTPNKNLIKKGFDAISYNLSDFRFDDFNYKEAMEETIAEEITDSVEDREIGEDTDNRFKELLLDIESHNIDFYNRSDEDNEIIDSQRGQLMSLIESMEDDYPELKELSVNDITPMDFIVDIEDYIVEYQEGYHEDKTDEEFKSELWSMAEEYYEEYNRNYEQTDIEHDIFEKYVEMIATLQALLGARYGIDLD